MLTMQKTKHSPGSAKPRLTDLLQRRGQTLDTYTTELGIRHDVALEMHCVMHGIEKDLAMPVAEKTVAEKIEEIIAKADVKNAPSRTLGVPVKSKRAKSALVDLTTLVHQKGSDTEG